MANKKREKKKYAVYIETKSWEEPAKLWVYHRKQVHDGWRRRTNKPRTPEDIAVSTFCIKISKYTSKIKAETILKRHKMDMLITGKSMSEYLRYIS